jgi:hypothetical protein
MGEQTAGFALDAPFGLTRERRASMPDLLPLRRLSRALIERLAIVMVGKGADFELRDLAPTGPQPERLSRL